jgi:hypothetical protein
MFELLYLSNDFKRELTESQEQGEIGQGLSWYRYFNFLCYFQIAKGKTLW